MDIVSKGRDYDIPLHEFLRAVIYGDGKYYDPSSSPIANIFDITTLDGREHFLTPLALGFLHHFPPSQADSGFVETGKLYEHLQGLGFTPDQIDSAVGRMYDKDLIETSARRLPEPGHKMPPALRVTTTGVYHIERLCKAFQYFDAIVVDIPILDDATRKEIREARNLEERLDRVKVLASYLDKKWGPIEGHATGFNWRLDSNELRTQIHGIRGAIPSDGQIPPLARGRNKERN